MLEAMAPALAKDDPEPASVSTGSYWTLDNLDLIRARVRGRDRARPNP